MQEFLPVLIGMIFGSICLSVNPAHLRGGVMLVMCTLGGAVATTLNTEWGGGLTPFVIDTALVAAGAVAVQCWALVRNRTRQLAEASNA
jgi:hypothetical protein